LKLVQTQPCLSRDLGPLLADNPKTSYAVQDGARSGRQHRDEERARIRQQQVGALGSAAPRPPCAIDVFSSGRLPPPAIAEVCDEASREGDIETGGPMETNSLGRRTTKEVFRFIIRFFRLRTLLGSTYTHNYQ
jgi:hypothetical protein